MYKLCKTEQSALRQRELERALAQLMLVQRYEDITVSEFCSHAGIPRKAFYRYFSSKDGALYALIDHTLLEYELFRSQAPEGDTVHVMEGFFRFWKLQKPLLDALAFSGISGVLLERAIGVVESKLTQHQNPSADVEFARKQIVRFAVSGMMIMMINWHHEGYRESSRKMAELMMHMMCEPLFPSLKDLL